MENQYEQFVELFRDMLLAVTGYTEDRIYLKRGDYSTEEDRMHVECIKKGDISQICALHIRDLYDVYCAGTPMEEILQKSMDGLDFLKQEDFLGKIQSMDQYNEVQGDLFVRLLNYERNEEDLQDSVYRVIGDIAMVLYLRLGDKDGCMTSLKVKRPLLEKWGMNEKQVFDKAMVNTYFMAPPRIFRWEKMFFYADYTGENFMNLCEEYSLKKDCMGNCLSTTIRTNGAIAIFLPGVAKRIAYLLDSDFYIVFTSIHEAMIHNDQMVSVETLRRILRETVQESTPEEDFLTYQIYHYESASGRFTCQ